MRDIKRLTPAYEKICEIHKKFPDFRIGQMFDNFSRWVNRYYGKDIFFIEDNEYLKLFQEFADCYLGDE